MNNVVELRQQCIPSIDRSTTPRHLGVILDGNRRWARTNAVDTVQAYRVGADRVRRLMEWCDGAHISHVTVWALSQDNLRRAPAVIAELITTIVEGLHEMAKTRRWRIRPIGALDLIPDDQAAALRSIEEDTAAVHGATLNVAIAYGGREDIVGAVRAMIADYRTGARTGDVTAHVLESYLSTSGQPEIDLVIRTSGEQRLSGFMIWQAAQAELYFTDAPWPDFSQHDFEQALLAFATRQRRYGR